MEFGASPGFWARKVAGQCPAAFAVADDGLTPSSARMEAERAQSDRRFKAFVGRLWPFSVRFKALMGCFGQVAEQLMGFCTLRIMHILPEGLREHPRVQARSIERSMWCRAKLRCMSWREVAQAFAKISDHGRLQVLQ